MAWTEPATADRGAGAEGQGRAATSRAGLLRYWLLRRWPSSGSSSRFDLSAWIFARALGLVYLVAFLSLLVQVRGLVGSGGILPADRYLELLRRLFGTAAYRMAPTLLWLGHGDGWLVGVTVGGAVASTLLVLDLAPLPAAVGAWAAYLSLTVAGQTFLGYQWDALLVEAGFLLLFLVPLRGGLWRGGRGGLARVSFAAVWLVWWLLFRLVFESGLVKLASGDPTWRHLTALRYHFHTQPLPNPVAYFADALPRALLDGATGLALAVELLAPLLLFASRKARVLGAAAIVGLQLLIAATGNYGFFNLLTIVLALLLFDDEAWRALLDRWRAGRALLRRLGSGERPGSGRFRRGALVAFTAVAVVVGTAQVVGSVDISLVPGPVVSLESALGPLDVVNGYGLFAVMTTTRPELVLEGRRGAGPWRAYRFRYEPGDPSRPPPEAGPYMPRLDWQLWFVALTAERALAGRGGGSAYDPWFLAFVARLLQASPAVTELLDPASPFLRRPPDAIRARLFEYRFTRPARRSATGRWWSRTEVGVYLPPVRLGPRGLEPARAPPGR